MSITLPHCVKATIHTLGQIPCNHASSMGESLQGTLVREFKFTKRDHYLTVDLFRPMANSCAGKKDVMRRLMDGRWFIAQISGCDEDEPAISAGRDDALRKKLFVGFSSCHRLGLTFELKCYAKLGYVFDRSRFLAGLLPICMTSAVVLKLSHRLSRLMIFLRCVDKILRVFQLDKDEYQAQEI